MTVKTYIALWVTLGLLGLAPLYYLSWKILQTLQTVVLILNRTS